MRIFALELNNDIKGIENRDRYIEELISRLPDPELVIFQNYPDAAIWQVRKCGNMPMSRARKHLIGQSGWQKFIIHISELVIWIRKTVIIIIAIL